MIGKSSNKAFEHFRSILKSNGVVFDNRYNSAWDICVIKFPWYPDGYVAEYRPSFTYDAEADIEVGGFPFAEIEPEMYRYGISGAEDLAESITKIYREHVQKGGSE